MQVLNQKKAALGFIFVTILVDVIGYGIIIPVMPAYLAELTGSSLSEASSYSGWLIGIFAVMQFFFAPILGNLSDQVGRRPVLLFSLLGFGADYLLLALAPSIGWLFVGRLIAGITGASFSAAYAYVADISSPEKRAQNFGMLGAAFGLGFIIGPALGGILGQWGPRVPFYGAAVLTLLNCFYGFFVLPESLKKENRRPFQWKRANPIGSLLLLKKYPSISALAVSLMLVFIASHAVQSTWSFYNMRKFSWTELNIGFSLAFVGVMIAVVQGGLIRAVIPKLGNEKSLFTGMVFYGVGLVLFALAWEGWMMYPFIVIYCLGGITQPALQAIISTQVSANEQGELQGALTSLMSVSGIIGPLLMTQLFAWFTRDQSPIELPGAPFIAGAALLGISTILAFRALKNRAST